ncbi:hypothetical protein PBI_SCTP2_311 [Salicola phage SCTP-2]|nr:hypothetical protein PBI_SCTP2_311 [Salicola phage SCTP-2]
MSIQAKETFIINNDYNKDVITRNAQEIIHHNMTVVHGLGTYNFKILKASKYETLPKNLKRAMGWCDFFTKTIVLNEDYLEVCNLDIIVDTLFHELAHALAFEIYGDTGHGKYWKHVCRQIGCDDTAKADLNNENFSQEYVEAVKKERVNNSKWAVVLVIHDESGKIVNYKVMTHCKRRLKNLERRGYRTIPNSVGNLYHIPNEYSKSDVDTVKSVMFQ